MIIGSIYLVHALILLKLALGTPLPVVTITQVSTFIAGLPVQTVTNWHSITTFVPLNPQGTETVLSTFSEALLSRTTPHQTFYITSIYLVTLVGQTSSSDSPTSYSTSSTTTVSASPFTTTSTAGTAASASSTIAAITLTAPGQGFPQSAVISLSVILTLVFVGIIVLIWRCQKYRKAMSAKLALVRTPPSCTVPFPEFNHDRTLSPPSKAVVSESQISSNMTSWTGFQRATAAMHPGRPVDLSLTAIPRPLSNPFRQSSHTPHSSEDYTSRRSSFLTTNGHQRPRSGTWGSTTTAVQSPGQLPQRLQRGGDPNAHQYNPEVFSENYREDEVVEGGRLGYNRWDEAIRRLDSLHQYLAPLPLNIVKHSKAVLHQAETPVSELGTLASTSVTPVSRFSTPTLSLVESSREPTASERVIDAREETLAALEGKTIRRKYSPSVYSRHIDGTPIEGAVRQETDPTLDWTGQGGLMVV